MVVVSLVSCNLDARSGLWARELALARGKATDCRWRLLFFAPSLRCSSALGVVLDRMEAVGTASPELVDVTDRRVEWMPWPGSLGRYGGGAGLRHCDPILAVTPPATTAAADRSSAHRAEIVAAARAALRDHAAAPQVAGCELPTAPAEGEGSWSWSSALLVLPRLADADDGVHNLFCQPWLFEEFIASSAGAANEEGKSSWPLIGLVEAKGVTSAEAEPAWVGQGGQLRPADQHCHLVGDPPIELEPGVFFTPEAEWLIGADMAKLTLAPGRPCCSALAACVEASPDGSSYRALLLRIVALDEPLAAAATRAIADVSGAAADEMLGRVAAALLEAGAMDEAEAEALANWRGD